jgi:hypothetical protein
MADGRWREHLSHFAQAPVPGRVLPSPASRPETGLGADVRDCICEGVVVNYVLRAKGIRDNRRSWKMERVSLEQVKQQYEVDVILDTGAVYTVIAWLEITAGKVEGEMPSHEEP